MSTSCASPLDAETVIIVPSCWSPACAGTIGAFYIVLILITNYTPHQTNEETEAQRQHNSRKQLEARAPISPQLFPLSRCVLHSICAPAKKWKQGSGLGIRPGKKGMDANLRKTYLEPIKILETSPFRLQIKTER